MTGTPDGGNNPIPSVIPTALTEGLDLFAAAWLEQWTGSGGYVAIDQQGKAWLGFASYHDSPDFTPAPLGLPDAVSRSHDSFLDGRYHGKMQSMLAILKALPHGLDALKNHMHGHGINYYSRTVTVQS